MIPAETLTNNFLFWITNLAKDVAATPGMALHRPKRDDFRGKNRCSENDSAKNSGKHGVKTSESSLTLKKQLI
jgi:hypothetical protein